jgi:hypothetical protein
MTVTAAPRPAQRLPSRARTAAVAAASLAGLLAIGLLLTAVELLGAHALLRDGDGFYASATERYTTPAYALTAEPFDVHDGAAAWVVETLAARVRVRAAAAGGDPLFVGMAQQRDIDRWLSGVAHERVSEVRFEPFRHDAVRRAGGAPRSRPAEERFWVAASSGTGTRTLEWEVGEGRWGVVVMNADGSPGVRADVGVAVKTRITVVALPMLALGLILLAGAVKALRGALGAGRR